MLYSFSQASYDQTELSRYFDYITENDGVLLWQNGVLLVLKQSSLLLQSKAPIYVLATDVQARNLEGYIPNEWLVTPEELTALTAHFSPHFAL